ncbi:MAG: hypothetical protein GXY48_05160 [Methanomicrobiales archaeon]|nr:hypothetical protein [Methanomicrobiales archaeon]
MNQRSSGSGPKIRVDRTEILVSPRLSGPVREELVILNEGRGRLYGSIRSDASWVTVLDSTLDTKFIQRIAIEIRTDLAVPHTQTWIHILSTGGIARIKVGIQQPPVPVSTLRMDEKTFQFCGITKDENISFTLTVRNSGPGFLSGTAVPLCDWIVIPAPVRGIWTKTVQVIPVQVITAKAPKALHPIGRIHVRTNGGEETVEVSIHRSPKKGPVARLSPSSLRISWSVKGIIEERLIIRNIGTGTLRGTIPSKYPWLSFIPSIFSTEEFCIITIRVDTRLLLDKIPASVPVMVITNAGPYTLNLEIVRTLKAPVKPRMHVIRVRSRSRMSVLDQHGVAMQIISSGKSGGEGEIWFIEGDDSRCVKIFHPHRCNQEMEDKIQVMQKNPLRVSPGTGICWPAGIVTSTGTTPRFMGYIMNRLDSSFSPVHAWYDQPGQDFSTCIQAAGKLAGLVRVVHEAGHCIGDLRENNVFIGISGEIFLIDTDSFQVTDPASSRTWFCKVGTGEYLPPELISGSFEKQDIDRLFADRFALAVLIFRFLMQGAHPYQGRGPLIEDAPTTSDKILRGLFSYERKIPGLYPPEYAPSYDRIPPAIRALFHEAFVTGHQHPLVRPSPEQWIQVLSEKKYLPAIEQPGIILKPPVQAQSFLQVSEKPEYCDENSMPVNVTDRAYRIHHGEIRWTDRPGFQILIGDCGFVPLISLPKNQRKLPPSVIFPEMMVYQEVNAAKTIRFLIPEINCSRYVHWHTAADSQSRLLWKGNAFTFRHRMAACRNLLFTILTIIRNSLTPFSLSPRSIFVGPDSSVRIIAVPGNHDDVHNKEEVSLPGDIRTLLFMMIMDGYHPCESKKKGCRIPSLDLIPSSIRYIFNTNPEVKKTEDVIYEWFLSIESALFSLIPCRLNSDHWYCVIPGYCPFCKPMQFRDYLLTSGQAQGFLSSPVLYLLTAPVQTVRYLKRRRPVRDHHMIPVIILPSDLTVICLLGGRKNQFRLPSGTGIKWSVDSISMFYHVINFSLSLVFSQCLVRDLKNSLPALQQPVYSYYDEIIWTGELERIKGELFPRLVMKERRKRQYVRKTFSVMIFPGDFVVSSFFTGLKGKKEKKDNKKKKVSKKLSEFFDDLL